MSFPTIRHLFPKAALISSFPVGRVRRLVLRCLGDPHFPLTFLVRNGMVLLEEPGWKAAPFRVQRARIRTLLWERCTFFLQVKQWLEKQNWSLEPCHECSSSKEESGPPVYCDHCGGCCEIASGLPEFPDNARIPDQWQEIFGSGLGKDHRFCPFLWENRVTGRSFCSIHPHRSLPCRTFGLEECVYLKADPHFRSLSKDARYCETGAKLLRLMAERRH